jgi:hypothetical protein
MHKHFNMTSGGKLDWYLGVAFDQLADGTMELNQKQYLKSKLEEFADFIGDGIVSTPLPLSHKTPNESDIERGFPYGAMVGSLMYAMLGTRPDLSVAVSTLSKYLDKPTKEHCELVKRDFRYVRGTVDYTLHYRPHGSIKLEGYCDASYAMEEGYASRSGHGRNATRRITNIMVIGSTIYNCTVVCGS